jgi:ABC-2 type transport system permease protein
MNRLVACIRKELLLLSRDLHGLALLFLMPLAFVLIMSLALQNQFAEHAGSRLRVLLLDADQSAASRGLANSLSDSDAFQLVAAAGTADIAQLNQQLRRGEFAFSIRVAKGFEQHLRQAQGTASSSPIDIGVAPDTGKQTEIIFMSAVRAAVGRERMRPLLGEGNEPNDLVVHYAYDGSSAVKPSAVQQSVPAWLVFGAFFVVVPLSNTLIRERQQGTLRRLRSTNLKSLTLLLGKLAPYFVINQLQVVLMLLAGRYLVPMLGGEALQINGSLLLLATMAAALSLCALGLALLIAVSSSTTEQATLLGGTGNIILAAIGGIMIPKFVMPATMQHIAQWSPMSWGLEGFLDVLLRSGTLRDIAPKAVALAALGIAAILLAWPIQSRRHD